MPVQTVISSDDSSYLHWQTQLLLYSMEKVGQEGPLVRLMSVKDKSKARPLEGDVLSYFTDSYNPHPITRDHYPPYNKAASLRDWTTATLDTGETLLIIDPDCVLLTPITTEVNPGSPIGEKMFFMNPDSEPNKTVIQRHCRRNRNLVQPLGVPLLIRKQDMRRVAPRWLHLTEEMREDKKTRAEIPWICEMWAYAIAAAEEGLVHNLQNNQQFPTEDITTRSIIHYSYGTESKDKKWKWDKRDYKPWTKPKPFPQNIPSAGKIMHQLLIEAASHFGNRVIS